MNDPEVAVMQGVLVGDADPEIVACEARLRAAQLGMDDVALDRLVTEELRVRRVGPEVAALRTRLAVEVAGTLHRGTYRCTRVWAREEGGEDWRVVGGHVSPVPEA